MSAAIPSLERMGYEQAGPVLPAGTRTGSAQRRYQVAMERERDALA
jgi:hypothetical protein